MTGARAAIPVEAEHALHILRDSLGTSLLAAYLHGSAVTGGLRPSSDVDVLAVIDRQTTHAMRKALTAALMTISKPPGGSDGPRPLELVVFNRNDLAAPTYPLRSEFVYGEWLRGAFEAGEVPEPGTDPEMTVLLAQARRTARTLTGPEVTELLPVVPQADLNRAMADALPGLLETLEGDERNVLLTLARMWHTAETGEIVPKDVAAEWAVCRLPAGPASLIGHARKVYLGMAKDDWSTRRHDTRHVAGDLRDRVAALL
ncbi:DUF4111 domain-containing protein [Kaustia mangrovi]|uniref:Aminoglycoside (3'') (9) adenylyltransferase n=1 Tax=Kaustia mangrovi TaxID=2593653 RepID=A0A7S8C230_9HYPH|nr:aminoglycoside adenylyltransferase family protein [Kaustia mangrovi]QPC41965.1 DUF4111 domain-containing protein [Kaustia mangrovi]